MNTAQRHRHGAGLGELERLADEVDQELADPRRVPFEHQRHARFDGLLEERAAAAGVGRDPRRDRVR